MLLSTFKSSRALNRLIKEICKVNRPILATEHPVGNAAATDLVTFVGSGVLGLLPIGGRIALGEVTVKRLNSINPNCRAMLAMHAEETKRISLTDIGSRKSGPLACM